MAESYLGEIRMFAGNFAPYGWSFCQGQLLPIWEYEALFSLIGTTYGGDGITTFALPDLRGRLPVHQGNGYAMGQKGGVENVTLTSQQIPPHSHSLKATTNMADTPSPSNALFAKGSISELYWADPTEVDLNSAAVSPAGNNQPHSNLQPYLCVNFIISLYGIYPSRS